MKQDNYKSFITGTGYVNIYLKNGSVYLDLDEWGGRGAEKDHPLRDQGVQPVAL